MKKSIVIIPTYNELNNIKKVVHQIIELLPDINILVIDDNSPDGTGEFVEELASKDNRIKIIRRSGKFGLGTAYVTGFKYMLNNGYEVAFQMDADLSHDPKELLKMVEYIEDNDLVIGSRYIKGVNVINWPMKRLLLSYFANGYTRIITGLPLCDSTGGFKCFRREVLESIDFDKIKSNGYSFQIEMNYKVWKKGFKIIEIPIVFYDREEGASKMSKKIVREAVVMVWKLRLRSIFGLLK
ncbi:polyprenol monophosphomannose synthase [Bacteroidota bacterium]